MTHQLLAGMARSYIDFAGMARSYEYETAHAFR
jgi:hypothetical protein